MIPHARLCSDRAEWDTFLARHDAPTFLQSWEWVLFNQAQGYQTFPFLFEENGHVAGLALVLKIKARRGTHLLCAHGPLIATEADQKAVLLSLTETLTILGKKESCDFIRLCPLLPNGKESASLCGELGYRPAPIHHAPELAWILDLHPSEADLLKNMRKATRYTINRTEKDEIEISSSDRLEDLERFWQVYKETADRQHFTPFSKSYLETEFKTFHAQGHAKFFFGSHKGQTISTALVLFSPQSAFYHHGASSHAFTKINASCAVQWAAIQEAKARGCRWYNFWGIAPPDQPNHPWTGLSLFKMGFGGEAHPYLHAQDKPLTTKYWLNYFIERIRAKKRGFFYPDPLKSKSLEA